MADYRLDPKGVRPGAETTILTTVGGVAVWSPQTVPATPIPLVTVVDGVPGLVFDNDGSIVYVEGP